MLIRDVVWWVIVGVCTAPIWGSLVWVIWEGSIRPRLIPAAEIEAEARRLLARWGDRAAEMAFIEEDRALNRPEIAGGSNFQIGWSHHEQDDEQVLPRSACPSGADGSGSCRRTCLAVGCGGLDSCQGSAVCRIRCVNGSRRRSWTAASGLACRATSRPG
jgi:hypothetical protein